MVLTSGLTPTARLFFRIPHSALPILPMPDVHPIRLRGPWEVEWVVAPGANSAGEAETQRARLPALLADVLGEASVSRARFVRRFGEPTAVEPHETVWLMVETPHRLVAASLNDRPVAVIAAEHGTLVLETEITGQLTTRNRLTLEIEFLMMDPSSDLPLLGEVWLEIRS